MHLFRQNSNSASSINADQYYHFSNMIKMDQLLEGFYQNSGADSKYLSNTSIIFEQQDEQLLSSSKEQRTRIINNNSLEPREKYTTPKKRNGRKFENSNCQKTDINKKKRKFQQPQQKQMPNTEPRAETKSSYVRIDDLLHQLTSTNQSNHTNSHNLFEKPGIFKQSNFHGYQPQKIEKSSFDQYRQNLSSWSPQRKNQYIHSGQNIIKLNNNKSYRLFQQAPSVESRQYQYQHESLLNPYVSDHKKYYPPYNREQKEQAFNTYNTKKKIAMYVPVSRETTFHKGQRSPQEISTHKSHSRTNSNISNRSKSRSPPPISTGKKANSRSFYQIPHNPKSNNIQEMTDKSQNCVKSNHSMLAKFERQILSQPSEQEREVSDYNFSEVKNNHSFNIEKKQMASESTSHTKYYHNKTASMHRIGQQQTIHESEYQSTNKDTKPILDHRVRDALTYLSEVRAPPYPIPIQIKK